MKTELKLHGSFVVVGNIITDENIRLICIYLLVLIINYWVSVYIRKKRKHCKKNQEKTHKKGEKAQSESSPGLEGSSIRSPQDKSFHTPLPDCEARSILNSLRLAPTAGVIWEPPSAHSFTHKILLEHLLCVIHCANHTSG